MFGLEKQIQLTKDTQDYNLNTSLRNYIDPRVYRTWANKVGLNWRLLYTSTLQRKMAWVDGKASTEKKTDEALTRLAETAVNQHAEAA